MNQNMKESFVSRPFLAINSREELETIIRNAQQSDDKTLINYDLSNVDCSRMNFDGLTIKNVLFSRYREDDTKHTITLASFVGAKMERVCFRHAELIRCNFDDAVIEGGDFFFSILNYCRFRNTIGYCLDFRYSQIDNCSLSASTLVMCDFYMTDFKGATAFSDSHFMYCSLTSATFSGNCPTMDNLSSRVIDFHDEESTNKNKKALCSEELIGILSSRYNDVNIIQDNYELYSLFYHYPNWERNNPCGRKSDFNPAEKNEHKEKSKITTVEESKQLYSTLSGIYTGKGLFRDSNRAYRMAKKKELEHSWLSAKLAFKDKKFGEGLRYLGRCISPLVAKSMGYGYKWSVIVLWFIVLVLGYSIYGYIKVHGDYLNNLTGSLNNSMGPYQSFIERINEIIGCLEPALGTLLIGFLGFVIANRIRNNS
jgi:uncharacterized protein YjbI with pentapeptide repeats